MTMWADNVKFVKDIVDSKYAKIETAAAEVNDDHVNQTNVSPQITEAGEALGKDATCHKSKEHFK